MEMEMEMKKEEYLVLDPDCGTSLYNFLDQPTSRITIRASAIIMIRKEMDTPNSRYSYKITLTDYKKFKWLPHHGKHAKDFADKIAKITEKTAIPLLQEDVYLLDSRIAKLEESMAKVVSHIETLLVVVQKRLATDDQLIEL